MIRYGGASEKPRAARSGTMRTSRTESSRKSGSFSSLKSKFSKRPATIDLSLARRATKLLRNAGRVLRDGDAADAVHQIVDALPKGCPIGASVQSLGSLVA